MLENTETHAHINDVELRTILSETDVMFEKIGIKSPPTYTYDDYIIVSGKLGKFIISVKISRENVASL